MERYSIDGQILKDMADAVRSKTSMTEIKTTLASADIYKTGNFIDFNHCEIVTESNAAPLGETVTWTSHVVKIPGAVKMSVKYKWHMADVNCGCYLYPYEKIGADTNYQLSNGRESISGTKIFDGTDTVSLYWRDRSLTTTYFLGKEVGFYFEIVGLDADDKRILLDDDPNPVEIQYDGFHDMTPAEMVEEINNMMPGPVESDLVMTGYSAYKFSYNGWNWFIDKYGDKIITKDMNTMNYMFSQSSDLTNIPFEINGDGKDTSLQDMFINCMALKAVPMMKNVRPTNLSSMFASCGKIRSFPEGFAEDWNWTSIESQTSQYQGSTSGMFNSCHSLRHIPTALLSHCNPYQGQYYTIHNNGFNYCYCLEEINNASVPYQATWTSNIFTKLDMCNRLKNYTFALRADGTPYVCKGWKNQVIDLTQAGFGNNCITYLDNPVAITEYQDWVRAMSDEETEEEYYADSAAWTVYDRRAAVRTINSLPDVSGSGGTNTIKFNAAAGANGGYGANTAYSMVNLTEEEIAVATAKGWTVSLV